MESWLRSHVHAFEHFHGIPALAVPDNTKTGVTKAHRYDPDLNPTYYNFAQHCGIGIVPARPYKARDKAKVESAVQVAQRWIVGPKYASLFRREPKRRPRSFANHSHEEHTL